MILASLKRFSTAVSILICIQINAQPWQWSEKYGGAPFADWAFCCDSDVQGNVYTVAKHGWYYFIDTTAVYTPFNNLSITKHSNSGQLMSISQIFSGGPIEPSGIKLLPNGDYIVAGHYNDTLLVGDTMLISEGQYDAFLVKFNSSGTVSWAINAGAASYDFGAQIDYSVTDGTLVWSLSVTDTTIFADTVLPSISYNKEALLVKLDTAGHLIWHQRIAAATSFASVSGTCVEPGTGKVFIAYNNTATPMLLCYSSTGQLQWTTSASSGVAAQSLECNNLGVIYWVGFYFGSNKNIGGVSVPNVTGNSGFIASVSTINGSVGWIRTASTGTSLPCEFSGIAIAGNGDPIVSGFFQASIVVDGRLFVAYQASNSDGLIFKLSNSGSFIWHRQIKGDVREDLHDVCTQNGRVYSVGKASGTFIAGTDTLMQDSLNSYEAIIVAFDDCVPAATSVVPNSPTTFCQGDSASLTAIPSTSGLNWQWQVNSLDIPGAILPSYYATQSGAYAVTISNQSGCEQLSPYISIFEITNPVSTVTYSIPPNQCTVDSVVLSGYQPATFSYQWILNGTPIPGSTNSSYTATLTGNYSLITTDTLTGCDDESPVSNITIGPYPVISASPDDSACTGSIIPLFVTGATNYSWTPTAGLNNPSSPNPNATILNPITYQVVGTTGNCHDTEYVSLTPIPLPAAPTIQLTGAYLTSNVNGNLQWMYNSTFLPGYTSQAIIPPFNGTYQVINTDTNTGCTSTSNSITVMNVGIESYNNNIDFTLFPNPTHDNAIILLPETVKEAELTIYNDLGAIVQHHIYFNVNQIIVNRDQMAAGIYLLSIQTDSDKRFTSRLFVSD